MNLKELYYRIRYRIPKCCIVMYDMPYISGAYRYCQLATVLDWTSQRHNINCPKECGKCNKFHHDYYIHHEDDPVTKKEKEISLNFGMERLKELGDIK